MFLTIFMQFFNLKLEYDTGIQLIWLIFIEFYHFVFLNIWKYNLRIFLQMFVFNN